MDLPSPIGETGDAGLDRPQVIALAGLIAREYAHDPGATTATLAGTVEACKETLAAYPQLDDITECYLAGPEDTCLFCLRGGGPYAPHEAQELPAWVVEARQARGVAMLTLSAIAEAGDGTLALCDPQTDGEWLAQLYRTDPAGFQRTWPTIMFSPAWQDAIQVARQILGVQPPAAPPSAAGYEYRPAIPRLSHASVRNSIPLPPFPSLHLLFTHLAGLWLY